MSNARRAKRAYDSLLQAEEELPVTDSVLPSLIATEETSRQIKESKASVSMTAESLSKDTAPSEAFLPLDRVKMHMPMQIGGYSDFFCSLEHCKNVC